MFWKKRLSNISKKAFIGKGCTIHSHVWIGDDVWIGKNVRIQAGAFIPSGVKIFHDSFIGPHVVFTNDPKMDKIGEGFKPIRTCICEHVKIGANATIKAGITIGEGAKIGMGAVVTKDVPPGETWVGNPAHKI